MKLSRQKNRLISVIALATFITSIVLAGVFGVIIYQNYQKNEELKTLTSEQLKENEYIEDLKDATDEDGTYIVYSSGDEVEYGLDTIIIE